MEFYYLILLFLVIVSIISAGFDKKTHFNYFLAFTICVFFITISSMRWERGTDWVSYYEIYQAAKNSTVCSNIYCLGVEPGYYFLNWVFSPFASYSIFLMILAVLIIPIKTFFFYKMSDFPFLALLLYFCIMLYDVFPVRQSLATSLCLLYFLIYKEHKKLSIAILIAALSIHYTSIIFFVSLFICTREKILTIKNIILLILSYATLTLIIMSPPEILASRINDYILNQKVYSEDITMTRNILKSIDQILIISICIGMLSKTGFSRTILNLSIFGSIIFILGTFLAPQLARFGLFFVPFQIISISSSLLLVQKHSKFIT
ncbi:EpsG family protein, partial [Escherichia coli]|nr:EpsG family protein [Escherichia coli]